MLFEKVKKEHILQGIKDYEEKGIPKGFGASSTYDLVYNGMHYPPKAIMAYANFHAEGRTVESYFKGGLETDCFKAFEVNGFKVIKKQPTEPIFQIQVSKTADGNFLTAKMRILKGGYQLLKGSYIYKEPKPSFLIHSYYKMRVKYENEDYFEDSDYSKYVILKKNITFDKPSPAAVIVLNRAANGKREWKLNDGTTLEEYEGTMNLIDNRNQSSNTKLNDLIQDYKSALLNDNWLYVELYKFEWANWLTERVVFEEQTDEEILELCLASQNENYTDSKGVQFIKQGAREKLSKYIGIEDIKIFRDFYNGIALENIDYSARNMSFPILSCWMSVLAPDAVFPASRTSFADIIKEVFSIKLKHSKIDFVIAMQKPMQEICNVLLEDKEITEFISKELDKSELSQLDVNWLVQDFLLYVDRHPYLLKPITETVEEEEEQYIMLDKMPTNQILYGPPGTGKTYNTINKAIAIANPEFDLTQDRILVKEEYARLVKNGQVVFTTFHQSMSYEDFVEGIKPKTTEDKKVTYEIEDGIFKQLADKAKGLKGKITSETNTTDFKNKNYFKMSIGGKNRKDVHDWCIENNYISLGWGNEENYTEYNNIKNWDTYRNKFKNEFSYLVEDSKYHIQAMFIFQKMNIGDIVLISLGNHSIDAIGVITGEYEYIEDSNIPYRHFRKVKWLATNLDANPSLFVDKNISQQSIYQFNNDDIKVDYLEQTFSKSKEESITPKNHVLIIDEINRGNVSAIFGELITLLESDKRLGQDEAITVVLPYSKTVFGIPANLHIIGTMNTADRSVEALDTALRRRFEFKEMMPDYTVIENEKVNEIKLSEVLKKINERIELLIDRDHTIGHSYFFNVNSEEKLANAFNNKIVPLLQEYFYGDYGKIGLVLGKGFVEKKKNNDINFADFSYENSNDFKAPSFLLKKVNEGNVIDAVLSLLGKKEAE